MDEQSNEPAGERKHGSANAAAYDQDASSSMAPVEIVETGDAAVDAALGALDGLHELGVREHVARFETVHAGLQDRLADSEG